MRLHQRGTARTASRRVLDVRPHQRSQRPRCQALFKGFLNFLSRQPGPPAESSVSPIKAVVDELLQAIARTERGLNASAEDKQQIMDALERLGHLWDGAEVTPPRVTATWRLLYTTEQETQFILKNAKWFGTAAGEVYQVIDLEGQRLQNVITFPPEGAFVVGSTIEADATRAQRINFSFDSAQLNLPNAKLRLPPFGKGWFDVVYMDDDIRVAQDSRGDTLVVARDGAPRWYD